MGFVYEDITLEQRIQIGLLAAANRGSYGMVSALARELETSRKFIYGLADKAALAVAEAMKPLLPGPKGPEHTLVVDRGQLDRAIVTLAMVGKVAQRPIAECLETLYRVRPSLGYISGVLARASQAAEQFHRGRQWSLTEAQVEADELFSGGRAHLVAVEHASLLILALERPERCDGQAWQGTLDQVAHQGVELARLASDGGSALGSALAQRAQVEHQLDLWHALRHVGRALRQLEQAAYKAIAQEEGLLKKLTKGRGMDRAHPMGGYVHDRYQEARRHTQAQIDRYEAMSLLKRWVREALEPIDLGTGRLRSQGECLGDLGAATALMREVGGAVAKKLADYLDKAGPGLLAYVDRLQAPLAALAESWGQEWVRLLSREWRLGRELARVGPLERAQVNRASLQAQALTLVACRQDYPKAREQVFALLEGPMRGSSLAECVNSWLRPYAHLMKGLGSRLLPLFLLYRNSHVFARGKRAGHSPFQLAGVDTPEGDWLDWLGLGHQELPTRTVRSLPRAA